MRALVTIVLLLMSVCSFPQSPAWEWARTASTLNYSGVYWITTDQSGNAYITGFFKQDMILGTDTFLYMGYDDVFFAKYNSSGNILWARAIGSDWKDWIGNPSIDDGGNVYISGTFRGSSVIIGSDTLVNQGPGIVTGDIFVVKYDPDGNVLWVRTAGSPGWEEGSHTATDGSGNLYITGGFSNPGISFDSINLQSVGSPHHNNIFLTKYDYMGNVLWARAAGGTNGALSHGIATDLHGNIYLTGSYFGHSVTFGTFTLYNSHPGQSTFLVKYDPSGNVVWAQSYGGEISNGGLNVATDQKGYVYITGFFNESTLSLGSFVLNNTGLANVYLAKLDPAGNVLWAKSTGGTFRDYPWGLFVDETGGVYITVDSRSPSITFGNTTLNNLNPVNTTDLIIMKYDSLGNECWATSFGGLEGFVAGDISISATGNLYIAGGYSTPELVLGSDTLTTTTGSARFFVAKASGFTGVESVRHPDYEISLFPNPMLDHVTVQVSTSFADLIFCLYDIYGRKMLTQKITETTRLTVSDLPAGIYMYRLQYPGGRQTGKLVKIH
jgi:hypothetical protein